MNNIPLDKLRDHKFYLENFVKIKAKKGGGLYPFVLNEAQKDLFNTIKEFNRIMILKARQLGFSTGVVGYFYVDTITIPAINTALIGYNSDMTSELLDKVKTFYKTTPKALQPQIQYNSKYEISFPNMDSKIMVLPSTENVARGYTLHRCLATELSLWEKAEEKMTSLQAAVPSTGKLVIESTPRGVGNLYHRMWMTNKSYIKKEYGWWWGYTREEFEAIRKEVNNPQLFAQEYELEFLASGRSVFDPKVIREQRKNILEVGDYNGSFKVREDDGWTIYKEPEQDGMYIIGADVSEGISGGDNSAATVWDRKTGEEVASYVGLIAPDRYGERLDKMGRYYNNALMVVEVNNHGLVTLIQLKQKIYPNLYFRPAKFDTLGSTFSEKMGWRTTQVTRPILIDEFAQVLREGTLTIHSKKLLDEMSVFVYNNSNDMVPQSSFHDDTIFSAAIGFQGYKVLWDKPLTQIDYKKYMPKSSFY